MRVQIASVIGSFVLGIVTCSIMANAIPSSRVHATTDAKPDAHISSAWTELVKSIQTNAAIVTAKQRKWYDQFASSGFYSMNVYSERLDDQRLLDGTIEGRLGIQISHDSGLGENLNQHTVRIRWNGGTWRVDSIETVSYSPKDDSVPRRSRTLSTTQREGIDQAELKETLTVKGLDWK